MGYLLVDAQVLKEKGLKQFETLPDGRGIVDFSMLRVLGSMSNVEVVSTSKEVFSLRDSQVKSGLYDKPEPDPSTTEGEVIDPDMGYDGSDQTGGEQTGTDGMQDGTQDGGTTDGTTEEQQPAPGDNGAAEEQLPAEGEKAPGTEVPSEGEASGTDVPAEGDAQKNEAPAEEDAAATEAKTNETEGGKK